MGDITLDQSRPKVHAHSAIPSMVGDPLIAHGTHVWSRVFGGFAAETEHRNRGATDNSESDPEHRPFYPRMTRVFAATRPRYSSAFVQESITRACWRRR